jgi:hypothetical protein
MQKLLNLFTYTEYHTYNYHTQIKEQTGAWLAQSDKMGEVYCYDLDFHQICPTSQAKPNCWH